MARLKKIPQRLCVGCQEMKPKREMIRIVRTPEEQIAVDPTGKMSGRGAYVCPSEQCLTEALKRKRLGRALERTVSEQVVEAIREELMRRCPKM
ncbi:MAG: YlxR family protein [Ammonifex sp.]|nr:MAG: YlxR family protein [Ammonifex sp.]